MAPAHIEELQIMACEAIVFYQPKSQNFKRAIGKLEVEPAPVLNGEVRFTHKGKSEKGRVESIDPANWQPGSGVVPKIVVLG
jgi:hypothetical protein